MDCHFQNLPEFRGTIIDSFSSTCANTYQHSTSYKEIPVPMTCLDCKSLFGNIRITEHNPRSIYGRPRLSLIVPLNSGNRFNSITVDQSKVLINRLFRCLGHPVYQYPGGGGGHSTFKMVGVCRWGVENRTLS